jgi:uncharacterized protein YggE
MIRTEAAVKNALACLATLLTIPTAALAQQPPGLPPPSVVTTGEGVVKRAPDRAWVTVSAESRAKTPQEAQRANAAAMSSVMQKLKEAGIQPEAIRTASYDLQPEFDYANNRQTLRGYVARNALEVRVDDLQKLGDIIDLTIAAGATNIGGVRFDIKDRGGAEREALKMAVADARQRADAAAAGAGLQVDRVLRIEESRMGIGPPRPMMTAMAGQAQESRTPVAPGEIEVRATVTLTASVR